VILPALKYGLIKQERSALLYNMRKGCLLFFVIFISCSDNEKVKINKYFDLEGYFKKEAVQFQEENFKLEKTLVQDDYAETVIIDSVDWNKMLSPFMSCDINKLAWINSYKVDSTLSGDSISVSYSCKEEKLPIQKIILLIVNDDVVEVGIEKERSNFYYSSKEFYNYHHNGFVIHSQQKVTLMDEEKYKITGTFVR
jgi:hypothetical protein